MAVSPKRVTQANQATLQPSRKYVLYWAQMNRRVDANHGLLYAVELANQHQLPVLYYEGLTYSYPYANDRLHTFILQGVPETANRLKQAGIGYVFYLRRSKKDANDILYQLVRDAAAVVTDDYPTFIARCHNASVPAKLDVPYYLVDSSCVVPMRLIDKRQYGAYTIRPRIHRLLPEFLQPPGSLRVNRAFKETTPRFHTEVKEAAIPKLVASCDINHSVPPSIAFAGGRLAAERHWTAFLQHNLDRYAQDRNEPSRRATSNMSPYLHFGQISSLEMALEAKEAAARRHASADEFLEELIVRRELSFNYTRFVEHPEDLRNLPEWARKTLQEHARDERERTYTPAQLESARTGDDLWNATQKEMLLRGKIHGYYRMYWGKKIIEWLPGYQEAVRFMVDTHGTYALDGRDPNTYTNILWCLGLHDRAWGERPVFGKIRYMSSASIRRKTNAQAYIHEIAELERTGVDPYAAA